MTTTSLEASLAVADRPRPTIVNVVSTAYLGRTLDLKMIANHALNAEYNPKRFHAIIARIREPKTTALIFSSGKTVVTGAKSLADSHLAARKYANMVRKIVGKDQISFSDFKIQNLVASCNVNFAVRLETLAYSATKFNSASYEAEIFPGLIYRVLNPKVVFLIFASGNVVITGAKSFEDHTLKAWELMYPLILQHRRNPPAANIGVPSLIQAESRAPKRGRKKKNEETVEAVKKTTVPSRSASEPIRCF